MNDNETVDKMLLANGLSLINDIIPVIKKRGRPLGMKNKPRVEGVVYAGKIGRPYKYIQKETEPMTASQRTYQRRGFLVNKLAKYKRDYGLTEPTQDKYVGKSNEVVIELLNEITLVILKINEEKARNKITNEFTQRARLVECQVLVLQPSIVI